MATIGLRKPYIAKYNNTNGVVSYTDGMLLAKAVELSASIESGGDNDLYADDGIAESSKTFAGGELGLTTDEFMGEASALVLGYEPKLITVDGKEVKEFSSDDKTNPNVLGLGIIISKMKNGIRLYRGVVFPKIQFNVPEESATTQGKEIEWQVPELKATIMKSDETDRPWKFEITEEDESTVEAYIKQKLGITGE